MNPHKWKSTSSTELWKPVSRFNPTRSLLFPSSCPPTMQNLNSTALLLLKSTDTLRQQTVLLNMRLDMDVRNLSMVMEEMKLVDVHHTQLIKNFTIVKGPMDGP